MAINTIVDGVTYSVPENGERGWGTEVTNLLVALGDNSLLIKGGSIPLTSEADFGTNFGLKSIYFKSGLAGNPSAAGVLRLTNTDSVSWRNGADDGDLDLTIASDRLQFEAVDVPTISSTDIFTNKTIDAALNTLSNIDTTMLAAGVLITATDLTGASDLNFPSTLAIKTYVDDQIGDNDDASEITYTPTTPGDWPDPDPVNVQEGLDKLAAQRTLETDFQAHVTNTSNPHSVTAAQVGLGNVDNTADADKPISTATQTALDSKADETITVTGTGALTGGGDLTANRTLDVATDATFPGNGGVVLPAGSTAQRGSSTTGRIRFNTETTSFEGYNGSTWDNVGGGGLVPTESSGIFTASAGFWYLNRNPNGSPSTVTLPTMVSGKESLAIQNMAESVEDTTINPNGSDTVDGSGGSITLQPGEWAIFNGDDSDIGDWKIARPDLTNRDTKWQRKTPSGNFAGNGVITGLTFNNLVIGKIYRVTWQFRKNTFGGGTDSINIEYSSGTAIVSPTFTTAKGDANGIDELTSGSSYIFEATETIIRANVTANTGGNVAQNGTYMILEELPLHTETTDFT